MSSIRAAGGAGSGRATTDGWVLDLTRWHLSDVRSVSLFGEGSGPGVLGLGAGALLNSFSAPKGHLLPHLGGRY